MATLWLVSVGGQADAQLSSSSLPLASESDSPESAQANATANCEDAAFLVRDSSCYLSCFRRGFLSLLASIINHIPLPLGHFVPEFSVASG